MRRARRARHPCMGTRVKRYGLALRQTPGGARATLALVSFFVRPRRFFVPTTILPRRRAQPQSRLAVAARVPQATAFPGHALTVASTARGFDGWDDWAR